MASWPERLSPSWILRFPSLSFLIGIAFASFGYGFPSGPGNPFLFWSGFICIAVASYGLIRKAEKHDVLAAITLSVLAFSFSWFIYGLSIQNDAAAFAPGQQYVEGIVVSVERSTEKQKIYLHMPGVQDRLLIFAPLYPYVHYGDALQFSCDLQRAEPFAGFSYDRFLATKNIFYTCFLRESPVVTSHGNGNVALAAFAGTHEILVERIDQTFGDPHAALLAGLLLGDQRFSDSWEEKFQATGTTHIVAASGYNVTVVAFILFAVLVYFGIRRQHAYAFLLLGIFMYVILAGADAPIVRAGIMGSLVLTSKHLGRRTSMTNILLLAAVAMLLIEPRLMRDDVGFQLSVLSTVALVYFSAPVEKWFLFVPKTFALRESLSATVVATLFTLPVILFSFGTFSLLSPIANLLILPILPYAMAFGALTLMITFLSSAVAIIISGPAWALLTYVLWVIDALASLPFTSIEL